MKVIEVSDSESSHSKLGRVVISLRGRDSGKLGVVVGQINDKFVLIADGDKRKFDKPKKKNVLHLEWTDMTFEEVVQDLRENGRVTNAKLRHLIQRCRDEFAEVQEKGE